MYDHIGTLILANLVAMAIVLPPGLLVVGAVLSGEPAVGLVVGLPAATVAMAIAMPLALTGLAALAKELIETQEGSVRSMFSGMRQFGFRAVGLGCVGWGASLCLATSAWFYGSRAVPVISWLGYAIGAAALWALVFVALTSMFLAPALVQKKQGMRGTIRLAALLVIDKPLYALGLAIQLAALSILWVLPPVALLIHLATVAVLVSAGYEQLARLYALKAYAQSGVRDERALRHLAVVSRNGRYVVDESQDDYLNRGLRDALFPWKE